MAQKSVRIACKGALNIMLRDLNEFQGQLKNLEVEDYEKLKKEIEQTGFAFPLLVWKDTQKDKWFIIGGHQRYRTLKKMSEDGWFCPAVPVVPVEATNVKEAKRRVLQDTNVYGKMTKQGLYEFMHESGMDIDDVDSSFRLPEFDMASFREEYFDDAKTGGAGLTEDDAVPEVSEGEPVSKTGDLWILGDHRVLVGDCTVKENIDRLMNGEKADMVFTDPPYGIDVAGADGKIGKGNKCVSKTYGDMIGDTAEFDPSFLMALAGNKIIFGGNYFAHKLPRSTHWIVWNKNSKDEYARVNDFSDCELAWTDFALTSTRMFRHGWSGMFMSGAKKDEGSKKLHPTQKPVGLFTDILDEYMAGPLVLDPFLGSGSTLIACEKTNRKCYGTEIDPHYVDIIVKRWQDYTGQKAHRLNEDGSQTE